MERQKLKRQQERLDAVSKQQWRVVLEGVTRHMTAKLKAQLLEGEAARERGGSPDGMLVGGRTRTGAHSELELGGNALFHYQSEAFKALYYGEEEWGEESLLEAMIAVVDKQMKEQVRSYKQRRRALGVQTEDDVEKMKEASEKAEDQDERVVQLQKMWDAVQGDPELERYVDCLSRHKKLEGVCEELHITKREADNLRKKVKRRTIRIKAL